MPHKFTLFISLLFLSFLSTAQCPTCPSVPPCSGGNGAASNFLNINAGQTYWYNGSGDSYSIFMNGGTLIVCGDLTIPNINFNSGSTIYVDAGATLVITPFLLMNGNTTIYNNGTLFLNGGASLQNAGNFISNCSSSAQLNVSNTFQITSNSEFVNFGEASFSTLVLQGGFSNQVCLSSGARIEVVDFTNSSTNSIQAPDGPACLSFSNSISLNVDLSTSSDLLICQLASASVFGSATFGSAPLQNPCPSCSVALPVELIEFDAESTQNAVVLRWTTASEIDSDYFVVECSSDGHTYQEVGFVDAAGNSSQVINYEFFHYNVGFDTRYYRLRQVDYDGAFEYSKTIAVDPVLMPQQEVLQVVQLFPNPSTGVLNISISATQRTNTEVAIYDLLGNKVLTQQLSATPGINTITVNTNDLNAGGYFIKLGNQYEKLIVN